MQPVTIRMPYWMIEALDYLAREVYEIERSKLIRTLLLKELIAHKQKLPNYLRRRVEIYER